MSYSTARVAIPPFMVSTEFFWAPLSRVTSVAVS